MIDYDKINKDILQHKWNRLNDNIDDNLTCHYDEHNHHSLCTHQQHCILNKEFQRLHAQIQKDKEKKKQLKKIYESAIELKIENLDKKYSDLYVGLNLKENRIERQVLKKNIAKNYRKLKDLETKQGGY